MSGDMNHEFDVTRFIAISWLASVLIIFGWTHPGNTEPPAQTVTVRLITVNGQAMPEYTIVRTTPANVRK